MLVGVTGANGFVGSHLVQSLIAQGHKVRALVRKQSRLHWLKNEEIELSFGEIRDKESLIPFVAGLDILIHCAALTVAPSLEILRQTNVHGTENLLNALRLYNPGIQRFVFISSQEAAGRNPDRTNPIDEAYPVRPVTDYGRSKVFAEDRVRRAGKDFPVTILRPSPVFGPRDKDVFLIFKAVSMGVKPVTWFPAKISMIYVSNLCQAVLESMVHPATVGKTYYIADEQAYEWRQLATVIGEVYGKSKLTFPITKLALFVVSYLGTALNVVSTKRSILNKQKYLMLSAPNLTVDTKAAIADFGFKPKVPMNTAIKETAEWYRSEKWV